MSVEAPGQDQLEDPVEAAKRLIELTRSVGAETTESGEGESPFKIHDRAQAQLDASKREFDTGWDHDDNSASGRNPTQTLDKLRKRGIYPTLTADEVQAAEEQKQAELRRAAAANKPPVKPKRPQKSARTHPYLSPGIRKLPGFDNEDDPSNPRSSRPF
ncbi:MAG TPA: hypothetical protein VEH48_02025 [Candidatus Nitrosopolaris sp.]|nr:hypothetical protein [Candidatus Nitrosopolaris sp.]